MYPLYPQQQTECFYRQFSHPGLYVPPVPLAADWMCRQFSLPGLKYPQYPSSRLNVSTDSVVSLACMYPLYPQQQTECFYRQFCFPGLHVLPAADWMCRQTVQSPTTTYNPSSRLNVLQTVQSYLVQFSEHGILIVHFRQVKNVVIDYVAADLQAMLCDIGVLRKKKKCNWEKWLDFEVGKLCVWGKERGLGWGGWVGGGGGGLS